MHAGPCGVSCDVVVGVVVIGGRSCVVDVGGCSCVVDVGGCSCVVDVGGRSCAVNVGGRSCVVVVGWSALNSSQMKSSVKPSNSWSGISSHGTRSSQVSISSHDRYPPNSSSLNSSFIGSSSIPITTSTLNKARLAICVKNRERTVFYCSRPPWMPTRMTPLVDDARTRNNRVERYYNQTLYIITCACNYIIHNNEFNFQHPPPVDQTWSTEGPNR